MAIELTFLSLYPPHELQQNIKKARYALYELHAEHISEIGSCTEDVRESEARSCVENDTIDPMSYLFQQVATQRIVQHKSLIWICILRKVVIQ